MPQQQTVAIPANLPLVVSPENRDNTVNKDARLINCFLERTSQKDVVIYRRPGRKAWGSPSGGSAVGQGCFYWNGAVYSIFGGNIYKNLTPTGFGGLDTAGGVYSFSSNMGASPKLVFQNGNQGYAFDDVNGLSDNLHSLSDSYPQFTVKGLSYLDGTMYVCQHFFGSNITPATIWGSGIDDVTTPNVWDPLNFIQARIEPDSGVYLAKQLVYVVCLKEWTTEVFYDVGNATGSPLASASNAKISYGCASSDSVQNIEDVLFWLSTSRSASKQVLMLERLQPRIVSTPAIDRLLDLVSTDISNIYSWQIKLNGHSFYVITFKQENLTLAYDVSQNEWNQWTDVNGNYLPICCSTRDLAGNSILQHESNGILYYAGSQYADDDGALIPVTIITPEFNANTSRYKQLSSMMFDGDQVPGSSITCEFSDDNYQTWSMPRTVDMSLNMPRLNNCGTFRKRAFRIKVNNNQWFRINSVELQFDVGTL